jgi:IclR family transcriptional regulator, pca regulon regulatory protein
MHRGLEIVNEIEQNVRLANGREKHMPNKDRELIAGLAKGLAIIEAFDTSRASLTVSEAAELAGLSRAAARRCLRTLQLLGHVEAENNKFKLTPRVLRLARAYVSSTPLPRVVQPIVEAMSQQLHHSMTVAVLDDIYVTLIARTLVHSTLSGGMALGTRLPAYLFRQWPSFAFRTARAKSQSVPAKD